MGETDRQTNKSTKENGVVQTDRLTDAQAHRGIRKGRDRKK